MADTTPSQSSHPFLEFDFNAYFERIMKSLNLPSDASEVTYTRILELVKEMVDDRIMQVTLSMFQKEEFEVLDEMLEKCPEVDLCDAILAISETIPELHDRLYAELAELEKEFAYKGELSEKIIQKKF